MRSFVLLFKGMALHARLILNGLQQQHMTFSVLVVGTLHLKKLCKDFAYFCVCIGKCASRSW
eukprot:5628440-Amphidinium_carterae.1